jgi:hypothetical protein
MKFFPKTIQQIALQAAVVGVFFLANPHTSQGAEPWELSQNLADGVGIFVLQNYSPYDITLPGTDSKTGLPGLPCVTNTYALQQKKVSYNDNPFVIAPQGIPAFLPKTVYPQTPDGDTVPSPAMSFVIAWYDLLYFSSSTDFNIQYLIKDVQPKNNTSRNSCKPFTAKADVALTLGFKRTITPPQPRPGELWKWFGTLKTLAEMVKCGFEAEENPWCLLKVVKGIDENVNEFVKDGKQDQFANDNANQGSSSFSFSAIVSRNIPGQDQYIPSCDVSAGGDYVSCSVSDAFCVPEQDIMVMVYTFRPKYGSNTVTWGGPNGKNQVPVTSVTVTDVAHYQAAKLQYALDSIEKSRKEGARIQTVQQLLDQRAKMKRIPFFHHVASLLGKNGSLPASSLNQASSAFLDGTPLDDVAVKQLQKLVALLPPPQEARQVSGASISSLTISGADREQVTDRPADPLIIKNPLNTGAVAPKDSWQPLIIKAQ